MLDIINNLPLILQYFIPGYVGIAFFMFVSGRNYSTNIQLIASCVLSYLLMGSCGLIAHLLAHVQFLGTWQFQIVMSSFIAVLLALLICKLINSPAVTNFFISKFRVSPKSDVLETLLDKKEGTNLRIYFKDDPGYSVYGHYHGRDTSGDERWIYITGCIYFMNDGEQKKTEDDHIYLCRISDIDHFIVE